MKFFETDFKVIETDLDELNHVNNIRYVEWVQEVAKQHWAQVVSKDINDSCFWVMVNHCIEYKNPAFLNDSIHLKTYILKSEGALSTRMVEITNRKTNQLLATSKTKWCLINNKTERPARISNEIKELFA